MGSEKSISLAAEFALEVKSRERGRLLSGMKITAIALVILLVGATFIPEPGLRRSLGLVLLGILLGVKGYASYAQWQVRRAESNLS